MTLCDILGHTGRKSGGLVMYTCLRCKGTFLQPVDMSSELKAADALIADGKPDEALDLMFKTVREMA